MTGRHNVTYRTVPTVVVGTGAAGLACALALAPMPVVVLTKTDLPASGSSQLAQGGIAAAIGPTDSPQRHAADTLSAGAGLSDCDRVDELVGEGIDAVTDLLAQGFPADRDANGDVALGREAAHSTHRIIHAGGDATGRALVATLLARASATPSIEILTAAVAIDLLVENGRIVGLSTRCRRGGRIIFRTPAVILATGGSGALWTETTNPDDATADGLAMAARAGAQLADLEFIQFHPTALVSETQAGGTRLVLLTEALRGAGARLIDGHGRPIMQNEHRLGDLAPRDVVARVICRKRAAGEAVFLDLRPVIARRGADAFPQAVTALRAAGYEPDVTPAPVAPAAHYHMGGILTDRRGRSSMNGLWACGEVAATGVHGANRLASNSLLEALVFARRVAADVKQGAPEPRQAKWADLPDIPVRAAPAALRTRLRDIMSRHVGLIRHAPGLSDALESLEILQKRFETGPARHPENIGPEFEDLRRWSDLRNMLLAARLIALAALRRPESRGAHFRCDQPETRGDWARRQVLTIDDLRSSPVAAEAV